MRIAFIAHDTKKTLMQNLCIAYKNILSQHELYATGTTGRSIEDASGLSVHKLIAGHLGGENQMFSMLETDEIDAMIFLRDPASGDLASANDIHSVMELCDERNIPLATNPASAELLIRAIGRGDLKWRENI